MVHAPELLGYEQYTPFPAACQWQSERPPPVAGAFAGLFMALGSAACADKSGRTGGLPRAFVCGPAPFVAANSTYSLRLRQSLSEGRPALAGRSSSLPWGPQAPFWRKGTPKTGKRRPPHFLARLSPFGLAPTVIYRAHPSLWTSEGRPALAAGLPRALAREPTAFVEDNSTYSLRLRLSLSEGRPAGRPLNEFALGPQAPFWRKGTPKTGKRRPPRALAREPAPFVAANSTYSLRLRQSLSAGKTRWWGSRCGGRARRDCRWRPRTPSRARRSRRRG